MRVAASIAHAPPVFVVALKLTSVAPNLPYSFVARRCRRDQVIPLPVFYARRSPWFRGNICATRAVLQSKSAG